MQAPTTPDDRPDYGSDGRTCAGCGAANGVTAAFCWQCYRPFSAVAPPPGMAGAPRATAVAADWAPSESPAVPSVGAPRSPTTWTPSPGPFDAPVPTPSRRVGSMVGVIVITLAVIGGAWWSLNRGADVSVPDSFGGLTLIENEQTALAVDAFQQEADRMGIEGDLALYGQGTPTAALIWIRDPSVPATDEAFEQFASGFDAGIGSNGSIDVSTKSSDLVAGVTYVCAAIKGVTPGTICMWQDDEVFWVLFDLSGQPQTAGQDLAVVAHDSIDSA